MVTPRSIRGDRKADPARVRAFTLVELLVVLAIIGLLAALSVPAIKGLTESAATSTSARHLASTMALARSHALAKRTVVRFGIVTDWQGDDEAAYRKYALWEWDRDKEEFVQFQEWESLRPGLVFEATRPEYLKSSRYAQKDGSSIRGDFVPFSADASFVTESGGAGVQVSYFEFTPSGGAQVEGGEGRNILFVLAPGYTESGRVVYTGGGEGGQPRDWVQFNIDTLTGRARVYRP